jgi:tetratricopeptide (TPR) repeat protein
MRHIEKTVFISYRRANAPWAIAIYQDLSSHGYDAFFDFRSIDSGDFEKIIIGNIKARAHFLVVLTPSSLENCGEPNDWLRREIETAMDEGRNIVPLMVEGFDFGSPVVSRALKGKLAQLNRYNGLRIYSEYFFEAMNRLRQRYLAITLEDVSLHALSREVREITEARQLVASETPLIEVSLLTAQEWFEQGYKYSENRNFTEAIRCYTEAIKLKSDFIDVYINRGNVYRSIGSYENAINDYNQFISLNPNHANAYYYRGIARGDLGDIEGAIKDFSNAARIEPDDPIYYSQRGEMHRLKGDTESAIQDYTVAINIQPGKAETYNDRGLVRRQKGDLDGAIQDYSEAIRLKPDYSKAYFNRGIARRNNNDLDGAIQDFSEAIRYEPEKVANIYYNRGVCHSLKGDDLNALFDLREACQLRPKDGSIRIPYFRILKSLGLHREATQEEGIICGIIQKENDYNRACFDSICGKIDDALACLTNALEKNLSTKQWALQDPDLEGIRNDPRFKTLVGE